jgi:hypothetical protein
MKPPLYKILEFHEKVYVLMNTTIIFMNNKYYECLGPDLISRVIYGNWESKFQLSPSVHA